MYPGGLAMMIFGSAAALAVLALVILAITWLARDLTLGRDDQDAIHELAAKERERTSSEGST